MPDPAETGFVCGFVSILGRPNVGKSTLLNALVGTKLAIVADKPQTTRRSIQGVLSLPDAQIIFVDTPGIHKASTALNKRMVRAVRSALSGRDLLLYMVDCTARFSEQDEQAVDMLRKSGTPTILILNKVDLLREKGLLLPLIEKYKSIFEFVDYVPISARTGAGLDTLRAQLVERLPQGEPHFPDDHITDQPERLMVAELIREKILHQTSDEVPHAVAVQVERWEETPRLVKISATIFVEREGQKGIIIGSGGAHLKRVGVLARTEMEALLGRKVFLELFVKVKPRWRESQDFLRELEQLN